MKKFEIVAKNFEAIFEILISGVHWRKGLLLVLFPEFFLASQRNYGWKKILGKSSLGKTFFVLSHVFVFSVHIYNPESTHYSICPHIGVQYLTEENIRNPEGSRSSNTVCVAL